LPDPTTVFAGPALLANVRNQSEHEALAARCLATWPSLIREGGGEGKRSDRSLVQAGGCGSHCCSPAQVGSVERRTVRAGEGGMSPAPTYHSAPAMWSMCAHAVGATTVMMERFDAEQALDAVQRYGVTHAQFVPTMFVRMLRLPDSTRMCFDLSALQRVVHAAAPCPPDIKRQMIDW